MDFRKIKNDTKSTCAATAAQNAFLASFIFHNFIIKQGFLSIDLFKKLSILCSDINMQVLVFAIDRHLFPAVFKIEYFRLL